MDSLNNARIILVLGAVVALLVALAFGQWAVAVVLAMAVVVHGLLWYRLYWRGQPPR